jgi:hypothetical protein
VVYRERDRVSAIELALELMAVGHVRGVRADHDPAELDAVLGAPAGQWVPPDSDRTMLRDFGLLEAYCQRGSADEPWRNTGFVAQLWRMTKPLKWRVLGAELRRLGYEVVHRPQPGLGTDYYEVAESGSSAAVFRDHPRLRGHIGKVSAGDGPPMPFETINFNAVHRTVYAAITRPASSWPGWLAEQDDPDPAWFRTASSAAQVVLREHPDRAAACVAFQVWLLDRAAATKAWPADEWAYRQAVFAADHRDLPGVPTPDAVAGQCLAALPMDRDRATRLLTDWREIAPADVRAAKMTRALLTLARVATPQNPGTVAEIARWEPALSYLY